MNTHQLIIGIALILTVVSFFKPSWPLLQVSVLLICVNLLVQASTK